MIKNNPSNSGTKNVSSNFVLKYPLNVGTKKDPLNFKIKNDPSNFGIKKISYHILESKGIH